MLECLNRTHVTYAITMRKSKSPKKVTQETYEKQMQYFRDQMQCVFSDINYELTAGLHLHALIKVPTCYPFTRFRVRGWSIKLVEIYDLDGWIKYINKDKEVDNDCDSPIDVDFTMPSKKLFRPIPKC